MFAVMARVRSALPLMLTVGAGCVGYQYVYRSQQKDPLQIYDGIAVHKPWKVSVSVIPWISPCVILDSIFDFI